MGTPLESLLAWLRDAPRGMTVDAHVIADRIEDITGTPDPEAVSTPEWTWRERLWTCPPETRIGTNELCEAVGRPRSWLYRLTSSGTIPHRRLDGALTFVAGEIREWLRRHEEVVVPGGLKILRGSMVPRRAGTPSSIHKDRMDENAN